MLKKRTSGDCIPSLSNKADIVDRVQKSVSVLVKRLASNNYVYGASSFEQLFQSKLTQMIID